MQQYPDLIHVIIAFLFYNSQVNGFEVIQQEGTCVYHHTNTIPFNNALFQTIYLGEASGLIQINLKDKVLTDYNMTI